MAQQSAEELKRIKMFTESIGKAMDDLAKKQDKRNKSLAEEARQVKSIVNDLSDEENTAKAIAKIENTKLGILKKSGGQLSKNQKSFIANLTATQKSLGIRLREAEVISQTQGQIDSTTEKLKSGFESAASALEEISLIGSTLASPFSAASKSVELMGTVASETFSSAFSVARASGMTFAQASKAGMESVTGAVKGMAKALFTGPRVAMLAIVGLIGLALVSFNKLQGAAKDFRTETGLTKTATEGLEASIGNAAMRVAETGAGLEEVSKAATAFTSEFNNIDQASENVLTSLAAMEQNFGVIPEDAAKVNKVFTNIAGVSTDVAQSLTEQLVTLADQNKVAPSKVMKDIADNAENAGRFFRGNVGALQKQAIEAAKIGSSLTEALEISKGLLDYDSSINDELEASAILNTNLNFSNARALAASGNYLDAQREIVKQTQKTVDLNNLNMYEAEALEKATGMTVVQMQNLARVEEMKNKLGEDGVALIGEQIRSGEDLSKLSDEELKKRTQELVETKKMQTTFDNLKNSMKAVGTQILMAFAPIGEAIIPAFEFLGSVIGGIVSFIGHMKTGLEENKTLLIMFGAALIPLTIKMGVLAVQSIITAVGAIFRAFAMIPFGIGIPLAIAAVAGMISMVGSAKGASQAGDVMSPADGKTQISTKEGGLLELSDNDDVAAAPGLLERLRNRKKEKAFARAEMNLAPLLLKMDTLIAATKGKQVLVADGRQLASTTANQQEVSLKNQFGLNSAIS